LEYRTILQIWSATDKFVLSLVKAITLPAMADSITTMLTAIFFVSKKNTKSIAPAIMVVTADLNSSSFPKPSKISGFGFKPDGMYRVSLSWDWSFILDHLL